MDTLTITIHCENDAFLQDQDGEIIRILRRFAQRMGDHHIPDAGRLLDVNGNDCGGWVFTPIPDPEPTDEEIEAEASAAYEDYAASGGFDAEDLDSFLFPHKSITLLHHDTRDEQRGER